MRINDCHTQGWCDVHGGWSVQVATVTATGDPVADECPACRDIRIEGAIDADESGEIDPRRLLHRG